MQIAVLVSNKDIAPVFYRRGLVGRILLGKLLTGLPDVLIIGKYDAVDYLVADNISGPVRLLEVSAVIAGLPAGQIVAGERCG